MDDEAVSLRLVDGAVVARATPADKLRVVRLLQAAGEIVAVTGDGMNDAPAWPAPTSASPSAAAAPSWPARPPTWSSTTTPTRPSPPPCATAARWPPSCAARWPSRSACGPRWWRPPCCRCWPAWAPVLAPAGRDGRPARRDRHRRRLRRRAGPARGHARGAAARRPGARPGRARARSWWSPCRWPSARSRPTSASACSVPRPTRPGRRRRSPGCRPPGRRLARPPPSDAVAAPQPGVRRLGRGRAGRRRPRGRAAGRRAGRRRARRERLLAAAGGVALATLLALAGRLALRRAR